MNLKKELSTPGNEKSSICHVPENVVINCEFEKKLIKPGNEKSSINYVQQNAVSLKKSI
jgi:hypothetical protein